MSLGIRKDTKEEIDLIVNAFELGQQYLIDSFQRGEGELFAQAFDKIERNDLERANEYFKRRAHDFATKLSERWYLGTEEDKVRKMLSEKGYVCGGGLARWAFGVPLGGKDWIPNTSKDTKRPTPPTRTEPASWFERIRSRIFSKA